MLVYLRALVVCVVGAMTVIGCARRTAVTLGPGVEFPAGSAITVLRPMRDPVNVQGQLERLLLQRGFRGVSEAVASTRTEAVAQSSRDSVASAAMASVGTVQRLRSEYALRFEYRTRMGLGTSDVFESFTATIFNVKTGDMVAAADFSQGGATGKQVGTVLREFVERLPQR